MSTSKIIFLSLSIFFHSESAQDTSLLKESWDFYYRRGMLQYNAEMYDFSIGSLQKALRKKPDLYQAANTLAKIYQMQNKQRDALLAFERSLKIKERQPEVLCEAALQHEFFAQYETAFRYLKKSIALDASFVKSHAHIVRFYYHKNNTSQARRHLARSIELGKKRAWSISKKPGGRRLRGNITSQSIFTSSLLKKVPPGLMPICVYTKFTECRKNIPPR